MTPSRTCMGPPEQGEGGNAHNPLLPMLSQSWLGLLLQRLQLCVLWLQSLVAVPTSISLVLWLMRTKRSLKEAEREDGKKASLRRWSPPPLHVNNVRGCHRFERLWLLEGMFYAADPLRRCQSGKVVAKSLFPIN